MKLCKISQTSSYIVFGLLTTLVNFIVYLFFTKVIPLDYKIAASLAWILAVLFAFVTNKFYVFQSRKTDIALLCREFSSFLFFRTLSYFADILSMIIMVEALLIPDDEELVSIIFDFYLMLDEYIPYEPDKNHR